EQHLPGGAVFGQPGRLAPADHPVAARQRLGVALAAGDEGGTMLLAPDQGGGHLVRVERDFDRARLRMRLRRRAVVEERDVAVRLLAGVVLVGGARAGPHREAAAPATETPAHLAGAAVDVIGGPRVAGVDQQRAVVHYVDRVD